MSCPVSDNGKMKSGSDMSLTVKPAKLKQIACNGSIYRGEIRVLFTPLAIHRYGDGKWWTAGSKGVWNPVGFRPLTSARIYILHTHTHTHYKGHKSLVLNSLFSSGSWVPAVISDDSSCVALSKQYFLYNTPRLPQIWGALKLEA